MKVLMSILLTLSGTLAMADNQSVRPTEDEVRAAIAVIKAANLSTESGSAKKALTALKIGAATTVTGISLFVAGSAGMDYAIGGNLGVLLGNTSYKFALYQAAGRLASAGLFVAPTGTIIMLAAAGIYTILPTPAEAAELDTAFLSGPKGFQMFLDLPVEEQVRDAGPRMQIALIAVANQIAQQAAK